MTTTTVNTIMGPFDEDRYTRLKEALDENLKTPMTQFSFEGHVWDRAFTKYMIEYLSPLFGFGEYTQ